MMCKTFFAAVSQVTHRFHERILPPTGIASYLCTVGDPRQDHPDSFDLATPMLAFLPSLPAMRYAPLLIYFILRKMNHRTHEKAYTFKHARESNQKHIQ